MEDYIICLEETCTGCAARGYCIGEEEEQQCDNCKWSYDCPVHYKDIMGGWCENWEQRS